MDITQLILDDHHERRRLFAMLEQIDPADTATLSAIWDRLATFLELHAAAEEAIFYPALLQAGIGAAGRAVWRVKRSTRSTITTTSGTRSPPWRVTRWAATGGTTPSPARTWPI